MLDPTEEMMVAERFSVAREQVLRDHLISQVLATLSADFNDQVVFFGGTALSRTFTPNGRLSEDIDLIAVGNRRDIAQELERRILTANRREYPGLRWLSSLSGVRDVDLWSLAGVGAIDGEAADLFARLGPTNRQPSSHVFSVAPDEAAWRRDLASQTRLTVTAGEALTVVRDAWKSATN